jgi:hypothetical protein
MPTTVWARHKKRYTCTAFSPFEQHRFAPFGFVRYADDQGRTWGTPGAPSTIPSIRDGVKQKAWFCGTPAEVIDGIRSIEAKYPGLEDFMIHWAEGLSPAEFKDQLRWFAQDVMPAFKEAKIEAE